MTTRKLQRPLQLLLQSSWSSASLSAASSAPPFRPSSAAAAELRPSRSVIDSFRSWRPGHRAPPFPSSSSCFFGCSSSGIGLHGFLHSGDSALRASIHRRGLHARSFFSLPQNIGNTLMLTPDGVIYGLIGANVAVFVLWKIADSDFMADNFALSLNNMKKWYLHTMLTPAFSHEEAGHLINNMICLYFVGTPVAEMFGAEFLLTLYLAGALGGSIFFLVHRAVLGRSSEVQGFYHSTVLAGGASAAVNSILLLVMYCMCPVKPAYAVLVAKIIGDDLWLMMKGDKSVSGTAHLGGAAVAALVAARIKGWI